MTVGFVFDTFLLKKDNDYYGMTLTYDFFKERYLDKVDNLLVITRTSLYDNYKGNSSGYKKSNGDSVKVDPIENYKSIPDSLLKKNKIIKELTEKLIKCDKVIVRMPSVLGIFACNICRKKNIPYMIEVVACALDSYKNHTNKFGKVVAPFMFALTKSEIKKCSYVLYVTNHFLQNRYPTTGENFACSDVSLLDNSESVLNNKLNRLSNFDENNFSMCTLGNVEMKFKGHIYVFKAIEKLKKYNKNIKYYLAGNGNPDFLKQEAKKLNIEDNIVFLGSLNHDKVFELLDKIDIYIQPSLTEGLPRALVEAMSRGCLCMGSNVGGIPELLNTKYIFKRKKDKEIFNILYNLKKDDVIEECKSNFLKSQSFEKNSLNKKRDKIYRDFLEEIVK